MEVYELNKRKSRAVIKSSVLYIAWDWIYNKIQFLFKSRKIHCFSKFVKFLTSKFLNTGCGCNKQKMFAYLMVSWFWKVLVLAIAYVFENKYTALVIKYWACWIWMKKTQILWQKIKVWVQVIKLIMVTIWPFILCLSYILYGIFKFSEFEEFFWLCVHTQIQYLQFSIDFVFHQIALVCIWPEVDENHYLAVLNVWWLF